MNVSEGKFVWSENEEEFNNENEFDTIEDALENAASEVEKGETVYVGKIKKVDLYIDVTKALENLQEIVYNQVGDVSSDYLNNVKSEQEIELQEALNEVLIKFLEKNNLMPDFYSIVDVKEYTI